MKTTIRVYGVLVDNADGDLDVHRFLDEQEAVALAARSTRHGAPSNVIARSVPRRRAIQWGLLPADT